MCGRFYIPGDQEDIRVLKEILDGLEHRNVQVKTGEVSPGDVAAVLASNRKLEPKTFGMLWGNHLSDGKLVINTRSETAAAKPMFADGMAQRRCLIPATHYYEWEKTSTGKKKYAINPKGSEMFYLAGIYRIENRAPVFSILTRTPSENIAFIHERMPVILPEAAIKDWLNPRYNGTEILKAAETDMVYRPA